MSFSSVAGDMKWRRTLELIDCLHPGSGESDAMSDSFGQDNRFEENECLTLVQTG
jgi:hypothetical protein